MILSRQTLEERLREPCIGLWLSILPYREYVATFFTLYLVLTTDSVNLTINRVIPTGVWLIKMCSTETPYNIYIYIYIVNSSTLLYSLSFVFVSFHLRSKD